MIVRSNWNRPMKNFPAGAAATEESTASISGLAGSMLASREQLSPAEVLRSIGETAGKVLGSGRDSVHALMSSLMPQPAPELATVPAPAQEQRMNLQRRF